MFGFSKRDYMEQELKQCYSRLTQYNDKIIELQNENSRLHAENGRLQADLDSTRQTLRQKNELGLKLQSQIYEIGNKLSEQEGKFKQLVNSIMTSTTCDTALRWLINSKNNDIEKLKKQIESQNKSLNCYKLAVITSNSPLVIESPDYQELLLLAINDEHRDIDSSIEYVDLLDKKKEEAKQLVKSGKACVCDTNWEISGSASKGNKFTKDMIKLAIMVFDTLCDRACTYVRYGNRDKWQKKIIDAYNKINKLYSIYTVRITDQYLKLKLSELDINFKYQELKQKEKEKSREIKRLALEEKREKERLEAEQLRLEQELAKQQEEQRRLAEYNKDIQSEIARTQEALSKLEEKTNEANELNKKIKELESKLINRQTENAEAVIAEQIAEIESKKEVLQAGFVYVTSNFGAFGENVFKIGVTRRADPLERINELGNASVPFKFNVHAIIPSDTAFGLEYEIHKRLRRYRVNLVNGRKEFFKIDMNMLIDILNDMVDNLEFNRDIGEEQYNETIRIRGNQDLFNEWLRNIDEKYDSDLEEEKQLRALGIFNSNLLELNSKYQVLDEYNTIFDRVTSDINSTSSTPVMRVTKYYMAVYMQLNDKMKKLCTFYKSGDGKKLISFSIEGYKGENTSGTRNSMKIQDLNSEAIHIILNRAIDIDNILVDACDIVGI